MDLLIFLVVAVWVVSAIATAAKKGIGRQARREMPGTGQPKPRQAYVSSPEKDNQRRREELSAYREDGLSMQTRLSLAQEGEDPCHEDLFERSYRPSEKARESVQEPPPVAIPGLDLNFDSDSLVKGVVYAEILSRKNVRRNPYHESYSRGIRG